MRYLSFEKDGQAMVGVREGDAIRTLGTTTLEQLLEDGVDLRTWAARSSGALVQEADVTMRPLMSRPTKLLCVGLNYREHSAESPYEQPDYPTMFIRLHTTLVAHDAPIVRPRISDSLDFEGEIAVVLGKGGRHIAKADALSHVAGYSLFNDASVREYQFKAPQWTIGKNFDGTGAFGPDLVTADELPPGAKGMRLETRLNGEVVQSASTDDMVFDVATLISVLSEAITLEAGDVIVSGTPSGIGWARTPKLLMRDGDVCEVSVAGIGTLRNPIVDEPGA